jgi:hypothetical protein
MIDYTLLSPNCTKPRNHKIDKITIHHMAGTMSVESCGRMFADPARQASSNYAIGYDGRVACYVEEANRAWTSGNPENDHRAVTIEVANDGGAPDWHVSDTVLAKLIDLCVDICKRNGIERLNFTGDKNGNLTMHKWFQATSCPGPYLESKFPYIAEQVNKRLAPVADTPATNAGDLVSLASDATYYDGKAIPAWVKKKNWIVKEVNGDRAVIDKSEDGENAICSPVNVKFLSANKPVATPAPEPVIEAGSTVRLKKGAKDYNGNSLADFVYNRNHKVSELKGNRAVITYNGTVVAAVHKDDLYLV